MGRSRASGRRLLARSPWGAVTCASRFAAPDPALFAPLEPTDAGKTIRIFLADGEPTGILLAEISNWTGRLPVAPRSQLDQLSKREEVRRTGVYLLVGLSPDDPSRALAHIGEGDNILKRLLRHNKNEAKGFWERTVVMNRPRAFTINAREAAR